MRNVHRLAVVTLLALAGIARAAGAQEARNHLYDRWQFAGALSTLILSSTIRVDPSGGGEGTEISVEDDLGLARTKGQPRLAARWRPGRRHELEAGYQFARRGQTRVLADSIVFRDSVFPASAEVRSRLNTDQLSLTYRFAFTAKENTQIGFGVGLGAILFDAGLDALVGSGPDSADVEFGAEQGFTGPTGSLGLFGRFRLSPKWFLEADARAIYLQISNIEAGVLETGLGARYHPTGKFGLEAGWSLGWYGVNLTRDGTLIDAAGKIRYTVNSLRLGVVFTP